MIKRRSNTKRAKFIEFVREADKPVSTADCAMHIYGEVTPHTLAKLDNWGSTLANREEYDREKYPRILKRYWENGQYMYHYYGERQGD